MKPFLFFLALFVATAQAAEPVRWHGSAAIQFSGTSTLHEWGGKVSAEPFVATVTSNDKGQPVHLDAKVEVKAAGMNTAEDSRDANMRKAMHATDFPLIIGRMDADFLKINDPAGKEPATLPFELELLGKKHSVAGRISHWKRTETQASFDLDFPLSLKECGISVPSVLLVIRVGDAIKVHASVKLQRFKD